MISILEYILPIQLIIKIILIIVLGLVTILGAYFIPKGKSIVIAGGVIAILIVWYIDLGISI